jgi:hypothetical protein
VRVSDASNSGGRAKVPKADTGVLANLPRTRPQRSSPRRTAARKAAGAPAQAPAKTAGIPAKAPAKTAGARARALTKAPAKAATSAAANKRASARKPPTTRKPSATRNPSATRKPPVKAKRGIGATGGEEAVPRQGFESDGEIASGPVQPPGAAELVSSAAELAGELAKAGVAGGARLLKDLLARLPPG